MLTEDQIAQVKDAAELKVRQYFDTFLKDVLPTLISTPIKAHDEDDKAHGSVEKRFDKMTYMLIGSAMAGGGSAVGLAKLIGLLGH